ncbi:MAG: hypothetical protein JNK47_12740 [Mesorhizobium sp.]|nr:hypothetical protein [Mesorhizobium sp.]MBL8578087.1 hypothetical protein [Mesorhizobium sp.]
MTEAAPAGSVEAETPPAGTPATPTPPAPNGSPAGGDNPFSGLSEGTRKWVETKGYKDIEALATAGMHGEQKLGASVTVPAADASQEEWKKFYDRLPENLRPVESPDKLDFKRPEGLPENVPYSAELATASKSWMAEAGLNSGQAQKVHDKFVGYMAEQTQARLQAVAKSVEDTADALVKDWGPTESEGYKTKLELANRAMKNLGLVDSYKASGILLPDGALTDPQIAKAFSAIGEAMFKEDNLPGGGINTGENPFKKDASGNRSITKISALVQSDPQRARQLAVEAGENPDKWMPNNPR